MAIAPHPPVHLAPPFSYTAMSPHTASAYRPDQNIFNKFTTLFIYNTSNQTIDLIILNNNLVFMEYFQSFTAKL